MRIVLWILLILVGLYIVFVVGPSVVSYFMVFKRQPSEDLETSDLKGT